MNNVELADAVRKCIDGYPGAGPSKTLLTKIETALSGNEPLRKALALALCNLSQFEPGDSRAVSNEYVAMAAVLSGDASTEVMAVIDGALEVAERDPLCEDEGCPQSETPHVCVDHCPDCGTQLKTASGGGVKCPACPYWFCH